MTKERNSIITAFFMGDEDQQRENARLLNTHDAWTKYLLSENALDDLAGKIANRWRDDDRYNLPIDEHFSSMREQDESEFSWPMMVEWYLLQPPHNHPAIKVLYGAFEKAYADTSPDFEKHGVTFFHDTFALRRLNPMGDEALRESILNRLISNMEMLAEFFPAGDRETYNHVYGLYKDVTDAIFVESHDQWHTDLRCNSEFYFSWSFFTLFPKLEQQRLGGDQSPLVRRYQSAIDALFERLWMLNFDETGNLYVLEDGTRDNYMQTMLDKHWYALSLMVSPHLTEKSKQAQDAIANTRSDPEEEPGDTIRRWFTDNKGQDIRPVLRP